MMKDECIDLISGNVRVEIEWIGEGIEGDYYEDDLDDIPLLRFSVYKREEDGEWEAVDDSSYCTQLPATVHPDTARRAVEYIMTWVKEPLDDDHSIKKTCEMLSWIDEDTLRYGAGPDKPPPFTYMTV